LISFFSSHGTKEIIFTGGEPLIRQDLVHLLRFAKLKEMQVTLSTNTLLLDEKRAMELLPFVDEIGIPVDGSNPQKNRTMRVPLSMELNDRHFLSAMETLPRVRRLSPNIEITIRTVVSRINQNDIMDIGKMLHKQRKNWDRWKLYQFCPVSIGAEHQAEHNIATHSFKQISRRVRLAWPNSSILAKDERSGKYVFLGPDGSIFGVGNDGMYKKLGLFQKMNESELMLAVNSLLTP